MTEDKKPIKIVKGKAKEKPALIITDDPDWGKTKKVVNPKTPPKPEDYRVKVPHPLHDPIGFKRTNRELKMKVETPQDVVRLMNSSSKLRENMVKAQERMEKRGMDNATLIPLVLYTNQINSSETMRNIDRDNARAQKRSAEKANEPLIPQTTGPKVDKQHTS
jgi:hypothetical protein